jgi:hypothetical protein
MTVLNESIKYCVEEMRKIKFFNHDNYMLELIEKLKNLEGCNSFEDDKKDHIVFALPLSERNTSICYPKSEGYALKQLVNNSNSLIYPHIIASLTLILKNLSGGKDFSKLMAWVEKSFNSQSKPKNRTSFAITTSDKISINLVKNNFLVAHYNAADLSMLSDFNEFKEWLNIVGKSFITLAKPFNCEGVNVYIRDTFLLTPASGKSLAALGKLYESEGGVSKVKIDSVDLEHMDEFLARDPKAFEDYAITDAVIPLIHAITLEQVNFSVKRIGVPITLSSLGRTLVLDK